MFNDKNLQMPHGPDYEFIMEPKLQAKVSINSEWAWQTFDLHEE